MKQVVLIYILLVWCTSAICQTGRITGTVLDAETKTPLELATISVLGGDSSLIAYRLSDKAGKFMVDKLPLKKKLQVSVTYTGYIGQYIPIQLESVKADTLVVSLQLNNKLDSIVVTATVPIRMNGDTLEINPAAFKMKQDAVVEELLNQISGFTMWSDGSITVNGKKVQNLLVDGKPFLGSSDPRIATQNLPKSAIDKIQLYQEYDRANIGQRESTPQDSVLTMNIKLKERSKKGFFGKAGAGYGTTDRFESDLSMQMYDKKSSLGIGGGYNNINKNIGNLQEMFQNNTYRNYNPNLYNVGRFGTSGINKNHSIGGIFTHSFIETTNSRQNNRIAVNYNKSGTEAYLTDINLQNRTNIKNPQFIRTDGVQNNRGDRHSVGINYARTNSYNDNLNVNSNINTSNDRGTSSRFTEVRDSANNIQSTNSSNSRQKRKSDNESVNMSFAKADFDNPLKGFNLQLNASRSNSESERDVTSVFRSFTDVSKNASYNRHYVTNSQSLNIGGNLNYSGLKRLLLGRFNLFGTYLDFSQRFNYSRSSDNATVGDYDSTNKKYITNANLSNHNKREMAEWTPSLSLSKNFSKNSDIYFRSWNIQLRGLNDVRTENNQSSIAKRNMTRSFHFLRYEGNLGYQYYRRDKYQYNTSLNYSRNFSYPSIDQLYTIVDDINAYDIRYGNPQLKNTVNHGINLNGNFNTQNPKSAYAVNGYIGGNYSLSVDPVVDSVINDLSGKRTSYYINAGNRKNLSFNYNFNISRKFKKNNLQLMYNGQYSNGKNPNYVDSKYNISETVNFYNQFTVQLSLSSVFIFNVGQTIQNSRSKQTAPGLKPSKNHNYTTKWGIVLNYPANFSFSSTLDRIANSNISKPPVLWNSFATYRFMKQQVELKFSAMDLLKQYQNISNSVSTEGTTTRITNGLQQYFLLTLSYYPRKFGKTEIKKRGN